jgi:hypothetical protein
VIEDLDGGDIGPSRAPIVRAISVALVVAAAIGWAALQQPALRGPYATPDPSGGVVFSPRPSDATLTFLDGAAIQRAIPLPGAVAPDGCLRIQQIRPQQAPPPGAVTITVVTSSGPVLAWNACSPPALPIWRLAP